MILTGNLSHRKHVFRDLRPYVCLEQDCPTPDHQYLRRREWIKHMELEHWRVWQCTWGCASRTFSTAQDFRDHLSAVHGQPFTDAKLETFISLRNCTDHSKALGKCSLCLTYQTKSSSDYARHVGRHLERLALFTIPKVAYEYDSDEQNHQHKDKNEPDVRVEKSAAADEASDGSDISSGIFAAPETSTSNRPENETLQHLRWPPANNHRQTEYFVPGEGIDREVIANEICQYLGKDALVRPGTYQVGVSELRYFAR